MADVEARIEQFKTMADADPGNELAHFSLGKAYIEAGRYAEAEPPLTRVLELNPTFSRAYQLLAEARLKLDRRDGAIDTLRRGYCVAAERGDIAPRDEMAAALSQLGVEPPDVGPPSAAPESSAEAGAGDAGFHCSRCGRPHGKMSERPFKGELGEKVLASICSNCWAEWIHMGTMVINEMGLQLADPRAQAVYDEQMKEFLRLV